MPTCRYWIERFKADFLARGRSQTSWDTDYQKILNRLQPEAMMTAKVLHDLVLSTPVNTKTRKRACMVTGAIAKFAGIKYDPKPYAGKYSQKAVAPRRLPTDEAIVEWYDRLVNPGWKWVYAAIATYGLRPHEAFRLDYKRFTQQRSSICQVMPETKTGERLVWAFHPEWVERFAIFNVQLPPIRTERPNIKNGESAAHYFKDFGLPFRLYDLRHRWAVRTLEYGLDISLAARQMGHSVEVHSSIYHHWIEESVQQRAYEALMNRPDRPKPP